MKDNNNLIINIFLRNILLFMNYNYLFIILNSFI